MTLPWAALPDVGSDAQRERWASEDARLAPLHARLGHTFTRPALLRVALTHPSWVAEHRAHGWPSNAALEFFGDAVLDLCSAHAVWSRHPSLDEGRLTKLQIELVSEAALASVARDLALGAQLWLGRGEDKTGGRQRDSNLADAVEAVLGAVFLDAQLASPDPFGVVLTVFEVCFAGALERLDPDAGHDPKSALQQLVQARYRRTPRWVLAEEDSPGEARERGRFVVELIVDAESSAVGEPAARIVLARGEGSTRREAEIVAARAALLQLRAAD
jgi:ribonuclease-3